MNRAGTFCVDIAGDKEGFSWYPPCLYAAGILLSSVSGRDLGCLCILDLLVGTVAKLESTEGLAVSKWCYVIELSLDWARRPGLRSGGVTY